MERKPTKRQTRAAANAIRRAFGVLNRLSGHAGLTEDVRSLVRGAEASLDEAIYLQEQGLF